MKTIRVDVKPHGDRELKIVWNDEQSWEPYTISRASVQLAARRIREVLRELVRASLRGSIKTSGNVLVDLARQGAGLYEALFAATSGQSYADRIQSHYSETDPFRLRFSVTTSLFAPWGLVYPATPRHLSQIKDTPNVTELGPYSRFWCISRELTTVYDRIPPDATGRDSPNLS